MDLLVSLGKEFAHWSPGKRNIFMCKTDQFSYTDTDDKAMFIKMAIWLHRNWQSISAHELMRECKIAVVDVASRDSRARVYWCDNRLQKVDGYTRCK